MKSSLQLARTDPLVFSFLIFDIGLCFTLVGSIVRRTVEMLLVCKYPTKYTEMILVGKIPLQAKILMYIVKIHAYLSFMLAMHASYRIRSWFFIIYSVATVFLLWIPFSTSPIQGGSTTANLQGLADRLKWTRLVAIAVPIMIWFLDHQIETRISLLPWTLTLSILTLEYFVFSPAHHQFWINRGVDFEKGECQRPSEDPRPVPATVRLK